MTQILYKWLILLPPVNSEKSTAKQNGRKSVLGALKKLITFKKSGEGPAVVLENPGSRHPYLVGVRSK